uniref:Peptidase S8/S53 domain-containing protein n=1 Tax=Panagrolaimus sp. ES5 TaxID=591445 RepID=A0AC34GSP3_9BILA
MDFVAPGIARVDTPRFMDSNNKVILGTSFSTPNAAGAVACLLSALKKNSIQYSPASLKMALAQTAFLPENGNKCEFGNGIIQIDAAFEYCKNQMIDLKKIVPRKNGAGGITFIKDKGHNVNMKRIVDLRTYIDMIVGKKSFKKWTLKIQVEDQNIICVTKIDKNGSFLLNVDTNKVEIGSLKYSEIEVIDPAIGCICYIPVTVIVPLKPSLNPHECCNQKEIILNYENPCHIFIDPPQKSEKKYEIKITPLETDMMTSLFIQHSFNKKKRVIIVKGSSEIVEVFQNKTYFLKYEIEETFQAKPKNIHEICIYQRKGSPANQKFLLQFNFFEMEESNKELLFN